MYMSYASIVKAKDICNFTPSQAMGPFYKKTKNYINNDMTNNGNAIGKKINVYGDLKTINIFTILPHVLPSYVYP